MSTSHPLLERRLRHSHAIVPAQRWRGLVTAYRRYAPMVSQFGPLSESPFTIAGIPVFSGFIQVGRIQGIYVIADRTN